MQTSLLRVHWALLFALAGCDTHTTDPARDLVASMSGVQSTLARRDSARLVLVARNSGATSLTLSLPGGSEAFDVVIDDATGRTIWRKSEQPSTLTAATLTIAPNDSAVFTWMLHVGASYGPPMPPGTYTVRGALIDNRREVLAAASPVLSVTVRP